MKNSIPKEIFFNLGQKIKNSNEINISGKYIFIDDEDPSKSCYIWILEHVEKDLFNCEKEYSYCIYEISSKDIYKLKEE